MSAVDVSFVIPLYNEKETLVDLYRGISAQFADRPETFEVLFVDDGSTDGSDKILTELCRAHRDVRMLRLPTNYGKAEALDLGFRHERGATVITMDADLQDDPAEIPAFIAKLEEGYDLVSGWKVQRHDPWHKVWPSRLFNWVLRRTFKIPLHDFNCGFKAYRREVVQHISLYGELHRYVPVLAGRMGARITEIPVQHHPRRHGESKYGVDRMFKGFMDLITVAITTRFLKRPLHFFGLLGMASFLIGGLVLVYLAALWLTGHRPIGNRPLLFYGMLMTLLGAQLFSLGIMAELFIHFNQARDKPPVAFKMGFDESPSEPD